MFYEASPLSTKRRFTPVKRSRARVCVCTRPPRDRMISHTPHSTDIAAATIRGGTLARDHLISLRVGAARGRCSPDRDHGRVQRSFRVSTHVRRTAAATEGPGKGYDRYGSSTRSCFIFYHGPKIRPPVARSGACQRRTKHERRLLLLLLLL